jgi:hypothetical protein
LGGEGEHDKAITCLKEASRVFPAIRQEMVENLALAGFFGGGELADG